MSQSKAKELLDEVLQYGVRVGDATSQLVNVALLFGANANESVSGRSHRLKGQYKAWKWLNAAIDFALDQDHCERAYLNDVARAKRTIEEAKSNE